MCDRHDFALQVIGWRASQNYTLLLLECALYSRGVHSDYFVKLVSEIAVAQQTRISDQTFEGVVDPNRLPVPVVQPRPYLVQIWLNYAKSPKHTQKLVVF